MSIEMKKGKFTLTCETCGETKVFDSYVEYLDSDWNSDDLDENYYCPTCWKEYAQAVDDEWKLWE